MSQAQDWDLPHRPMTPSRKLEQQDGSSFMFNRSRAPGPAILNRSQPAFKRGYLVKKGKFVTYACKYVICLPTEHQGVHKNSFRNARAFQDRIGIWKCWFLRREENRSTRRKTSRSRVENQQQTQPTYDAGSGNRTRDTLVGDKRSYHCTISAPQVPSLLLSIVQFEQFSIERRKTKTKVIAQPITKDSDSERIRTRSNCI